MGEIVLKQRRADDPVGAREFEFLTAYRVTSIGMAPGPVAVGDVLVRLPAPAGLGSGLFNTTQKLMVWDHGGFWDSVRGVRDRNVLEISICFDKG